MDRYRKEVLQGSTRKHGINVQYLYDKNKNGIGILDARNLEAIEFFMSGIQMVKSNLICLTI